MYDIIDLIFCIKILKDPRLILIDEPVLHSHPKLQKVLPFILKYIQEITNTQFLISTHNPFIISAAAEFGETQKVYLIKKGEVMDKDRKKKSEIGFDIEAEKSYHGIQIANVVAKMLGAEGKNLGYPENFCILEEPGLGSILEHCANKKFIKNWKFIPADGNYNRHPAFQTF